MDSYLYMALSLPILMAIFPGEPRLAGFIAAKDDESGDWQLELKDMQKLQSNRHHQQTNTQLFTRWMPFLSPNQQ